MPAPAKLIGRHFGHLTVLGRARTASTRVYWACACDCGGSHVARTDHLMSGAIDHCGCDRRAH
jgi:hypothetical protein